MRRHLVLPNLCRNSAILVIVLLSQLIVIIGWLILPRGIDGITALGLASIYSLFVALIGAALLCLSRARIAKQSFALGIALALLVMVFSLLLVELAYQSLMPAVGVDTYNYTQLGRRCVAALLVSVILLRFISLIELFNQHSRAEAESRVLALQSRIQPHFLFNSLNTISELAATDGVKAEAATTALAALFRASLENNRNFHSLQQEINLCQRYIELERFRIQDKLVIEWHVAVDDVERWRMPKLMLQPLLENALVHGMQANGQIFVKLDVRKTSNHLSVMIENKVGEIESPKSGHGIAIKNIQQRLETLYDDQFTFRSKLFDDVYSVVLRIPKQVYSKSES